jgi:hypothetical protein
VRGRGLGGGRSLRSSGTSSARPLAPMTFPSRCCSLYFLVLPLRPRPCEMVM